MGSKAAGTRRVPEANGLGNRLAATAVFVAGRTAHGVCLLLYRSLDLGFLSATIAVRLDGIVE